MSLARLAGGGILPASRQSRRHLVAATRLLTGKNGEHVAI
jgi:RNase P/RNase MRP subunit POP5